MYKHPLCPSVFYLPIFMHILTNYKWMTTGSNRSLPLAFLFSFNLSSCFLSFFQFWKVLHHESLVTVILSVPDPKAWRYGKAQTPMLLKILYLYSTLNPKPGIALCTQGRYWPLCSVTGDLPAVFSPSQRILPSRLDYTIWPLPRMKLFCSPPDAFLINGHFKTSQHDSITS